MTANMRESVTTTYSRTRGDADDPARYRPICVTAVEYRILATAMAQRLAEVLHRLVGESQIGFLLKRLISENIDLMEETLRYINEDAPQKGGAIAVLDLMPTPTTMSRGPSCTNASRRSGSRRASERW